MKYKIKKKLIHFYTTGNIAEDFVMSRRRKVAKFRKVIRTCFYLHCAAALLCIGLAILFGTGLEVVLITLGVVIAAWIALFSVGDVPRIKLLLIAYDLVLAAAGIAIGNHVDHKAAFYSCSAVMIIAGIAAAFSYVAGRFKDYLESVSPRLIRRDDYTMLPNFAPETDDVILPSPDEELPPLPPLTSEMRELAIQFKEILCAVHEKEPEDEIIDEITGSIHEREKEEKIPVKTGE